MSIRKLMNYWFQKSRDGFYIFFGILAAGLYALGTALGFYLQESVLSWVLKLSAVILAIFLGLFYLVHKNLHSLHHFWDMFHQTDHFPEKQLAHVNAFCMTVFLLISALVLSVVPPLFDPLWAWIWRGLQYLTHTSSSAPVEMEQNTSAMLNQPGLLPSLAEQTGEAPAWMKFIDRIMGIFAVLLLSLLTVLVLRQIARSIWTFFTKPRHFDDDEKIYLKPSLHLDTETAKNGFRPAIAFLPVRTPGEKIRRLYRQRILKHFSQKTAGILPRWASPSELEETCGMDQPALHELYEKARYGNVPCTREDLEQLKKSK
mgnify:FL=1